MPGERGDPHQGHQRLHPLAVHERALGAQQYRRHPARAEKWPGREQQRRMRGLSRQRERRLRKLFALGAAALMRNARSRPERATEWQRGVLARRPVKVAVMAEAAKIARIAWAVLTSGERYAPRTAA